VQYRLKHSTYFNSLPERVCLILFESHHNPLSRSTAPRTIQLRVLLQDQEGWWISVPYTSYPEMDYILSEMKVFSYGLWRRKKPIKVSLTQKVRLSYKEACLVRMPGHNKLDKVLRAVNINTQVLWDFMPRNTVETKTEDTGKFLWNFIYQTTQRHIEDDHNLHIQGSDNLKSQIVSSSTGVWQSYNPANRQFPYKFPSKILSYFPQTLIVLLPPPHSSKWLLCNRFIHQNFGCVSCIALSNLLSYAP